MSANSHLGRLTSASRLFAQVFPSEWSLVAFVTDTRVLPLPPLDRWGFGGSSGQVVAWPSARSPPTDQTLNEQIPLLFYRALRVRKSQLEPQPSGDPANDGRAQELREDFPPTPGFTEPIPRKLEKIREGNRKVILVGLLAYLALWSLGSLALAAFGRTQDAIELAKTLAIPALPLLGIAIGSYFEQGRR